MAKPITFAWDNALKLMQIFCYEDRPLSPHSIDSFAPVDPIWRHGIRQHVYFMYEEICRIVTVDDIFHFHLNIPSNFRAR